MSNTIAKAHPSPDTGTDFTAGSLVVYSGGHDIIPFVVLCDGHVGTAYGEATFSGTVVFTGDARVRELGEYAQDFVQSLFKNYRGTITLSTL